jgi:hypothetical protein
VDRCIETNVDLYEVFTAIFIVLYIFRQAEMQVMFNKTDVVASDCQFMDIGLLLIGLLAERFSSSL